jgi:hypothetical protein
MQIHLPALDHAGRRPGKQNPSPAARPPPGQPDMPGHRHHPIDNALIGRSRQLGREVAAGPKKQP